MIDSECETKRSALADCRIDLDAFERVRHLDRHRHWTLSADEKRECVDAHDALAQPSTSFQTAVERGRMLVIGGACHDCHTPKKFGPKRPEPDMDRMLSGHPEGDKVAAPYKPAVGSPWVVAAHRNVGKRIRVSLSIRW
jgi:hypothetical protein